MKMTPGFVYILLNSSMPGVLKIGKTARPPEERAAELSTATGLPTPFIVAYDSTTADCDEVERRIHKRLNPRRVSPDREFFALGLKEAIQIVSEICAAVNSELPPGVAPAAPSLPFSTCIARVTCEQCQCMYTVTLRRYEGFVVCLEYGHGQSYQVQWGDGRNAESSTLDVASLAPNGALEPKALMLF